MNPHTFMFKGDGRRPHSEGWIDKIFIIEARNVKFGILIEQMKIIFYLCENFDYLHTKQVI